MLCPGRREMAAILGDQLPVWGEQLNAAIGIGQQLEQVDKLCIHNPRAIEVVLDTDRLNRRRAKVASRIAALREQCIRIPTKILEANHDYSLRTELPIQRNVLTPASSVERSQNKYSNIGLRKCSTGLLRNPLRGPLDRKSVV